MIWFSASNRESPSPQGEDSGQDWSCRPSTSFCCHPVATVHVAFWMSLVKSLFYVKAGAGLSKVEADVPRPHGTKAAWAGAAPLHAAAGISLSGPCKCPAPLPPLVFHPKPKIFAKIFCHASFTLGLDLQGSFVCSSPS